MIWELEWVQKTPWLEGGFCYTIFMLDLRSTEYKRFIATGDIYVDYTGGGQCPQSALDQYYQLASSIVFGNPHSNNPTSLYTTRLIEAVRQQVLDYFSAGDDYELIFTANATGALKILGESYPWNSDTVLLLSRDNHNSVLGIREYAKRAGATVAYWELDDELRLIDTIEDTIKQYSGKNVVVAFPAQSNFSGVIHPLDYIQKIHALGAQVWLDTAAFVPTHSFNMQQFQPEAICISFYKLLGFPTGVGALVIKKELLETLRKPWFAGGTVRGVSLDTHVLESGHESFEDGTINYASIPALKFVFEFIEKIGGVQMIEEHVTVLTQQALTALTNMKHVTIYGPRTMEKRGATIAFNIQDQSGKIVPYSTVETWAAQRKISLRGGCFCNPGSGSKALGVSGETLQYYLAKLHVETKEQVGVPGAVRISFGLGNTAEDIAAVIACIADAADLSAS